MTIEKIRLDNARALVKECGNASRFGERLGYSRQLVSNYIGRRPTRHIGSELARKIELAFGKPVGWMDRDHAAKQPAVMIGSVLIDALDAGGVLGAGRLPMLRDHTVQQMRVSADWLKRHIGPRAGEYLAMATVTGDSMGDALPEGSLVIVDTAASSAQDDGIYMLGRRDSESPGVWFRRVVRQLDGSYKLSTKNKTDQALVPSLSKAGIVVLGRVVARLELVRV